MKYQKYSTIIILITVFFFPTITSAMTLEIENKDAEVQQGDIIILDVYLNSENEINSLEGTIILSGDYNIKTITTAGSVFDMWPNKPSYQDGAISFVGGSVSSVFGNRLKIFSIILEIQSERGVTFTSDKVSAFLSNGIGTKITVNPLEKNIALLESDGIIKNKFEEILLSDKEPPVPFVVEIGKDVNLYDGKYFASFNTTDRDSGIERYEVIENNTKTPIVTGTTYVLQDQTLTGTLMIKAVDKAGNVQVVEINVKDNISKDDSINWKSLSIALLILIILFIIFKKIKIKNVRI